jgi:hypothetical protein
MINNSISEQNIGEASIGYWASQEQYSMQQLIEFVKERLLYIGIIRV